MPRRSRASTHSCRGMGAPAQIIFSRRSGRHSAARPTRSRATVGGPYRYVTPSSSTSSAALRASQRSMDTSVAPVCSAKRTPQHSPAPQLMGTPQRNVSSGPRLEQVGDRPLAVAGVLVGVHDTLHADGPRRVEDERRVVGTGGRGRRRETRFPRRRTEHLVRRSRAPSPGCGGVRVDRLVVHLRRSCRGARPSANPTARTPGRSRAHGTAPRAGCAPRPVDRTPRAARRRPRRSGSCADTMSPAATPEAREPGSGPPGRIPQLLPSEPLATVDDGRPLRLLRHPHRRRRR